MKMNSQKIKNKISAYLDGELDKEQAEEMEILLRNDPGLRAEYEQLKGIYGYLDSQRRTITDPFFNTRLKVRLQQTRQPGISIWERLNWARKFILPASVFVGLIVGLMLGLQIQDKVLNPSQSADNGIAQKYFGGKVLSAIPEGSITENYIKFSSQVK